MEINSEKRKSIIDHVINMCAKRIIKVVVLGSNVDASNIMSGTFHVYKKKTDFFWQILDFFPHWIPEFP
jgi:hypothetical protein